MTGNAHQSVVLSKRQTRRKFLRNTGAAVAAASFGAVPLRGWAADPVNIGGLYPTNTSGGHLSESYMQGWALNVEAVRQVRGACGARQVADCAFAHYMAAAPVVTSIIYGRDPS